MMGLRIFWDTAEYCIDTMEIDMKEQEIVHSLFFVFLFKAFNTLVELPFSMYMTFVLEEEHGFNKQTGWSFAKEQILRFLVSQIVTIPLVAAVIKIIEQGGDFFLVYLCAFSLVPTLVIMVIYPMIIVPLFDRLLPLPQGQLRE
jgi:STE24 endopeptidase